MLVMPFAAFVEQGRICKSVKAWREAALADGRLVVHVRHEGVRVSTSLRYPSSSGHSQPELCGSSSLCRIVPRRG
jgi:hypothetical protein